ncbi:SGNH/GDSL hydrolase family protein [Marinactinospora rubrisoli]|uniref:SGNH/GDSL hydrolase family protein n=1 Tax=Marinactinospora rubrisoli TaxID=2715399 RepID=A0ABW2KHK2_9ACTN
MKNVAAIVLAGALTVGFAAVPVPSPASAAPAGDGTGTEPLTQVHSAGRFHADGDLVRYSWPGVYFEGRFRGTGVGIVLDDPAADYDVQVDGEVVTTLVTPTGGTHWVDGLTDGAHAVRLVKRSESPWAESTFGGLVAAPGGAILDRPAARGRQIEFIGDSYTAGYGNLSGTRVCTGDEVNRTTNADRSFGALTAQRLDADYQINAYSGLGMVRNYNGQRPEVDYRSFYDRALLGVDGDRWQRPAGWRPQLVVVGLGINDFSTAINPGEPWTPDGLVTAYEAAYHDFLDELRARYGTGTVIVVSATHLSNTTVFAETAQEIVSDRNDQGDDRVRYWYYDGSGLDYLGCDWHPSARDHELIADRLGRLIATLPLDW